MRFGPDPGTHLTIRENRTAVFMAAGLIGLALANKPALMAGPVAVIVWLAYRSVRRARAVTRANARGVINSARDAARRPRRAANIQTQLAALEEALGDWQPGRRWLNEIKEGLRLDADENGVGR